MRLRVLVVDDSADDAKLIVRRLAKQGLDVEARRVDTRESMQAALREGPWDVILADHTMPEFSALAALETLQSIGLDLPFIIVSGLIGEDVAVRAMKAGAHDYIMKGNLARLGPAIEREVREAAVRHERRQADEALRAANAELERRVEARTQELAEANEELYTTNEELAQVNEALRRHQEEEISVLKEIDRQKDEFLSIAAHELKTPITSLLGFAQVMLQQYESKGAVDPERLTKGLSTIVRQAHKLTTLVSQLLDMTRIEGGRLALEPQCSDLVHIVRDVAHTIQQTGARHQIVIQAPDMAEAMVDPLRIEQVITNLVNNAIQHSPAGLIEIGLEANNGSLEIAVRDHGLGIPPEHLPHIFERFYQAHHGKHTAGLGLGLYISSQIVTLHGGQIRAECPADGGARFVVSLPACQRDRDRKFTTTSHDA